MVYEVTYELLLSLHDVPEVLSGQSMAPRVNTQAEILDGSLIRLLASLIYGLI